MQTRPQLSHPQAPRPLQKPVSIIVAALTLALAIGAMSVTLSLVYGVLLRPQPYPFPEQLVEIWETQSRSGLDEMAISYPNYEDWREQNQVFEQVALFTSRSFNLTGVREPRRVQTAIVSANFFQTIGANPALGRTFVPDEERPGATQVAIISDPLWKSSFREDPSVVGQVIILDGHSVVIVGVMPKDFQFPRQAQLWQPINQSSGPMNNRGAHFLRSIARLNPGVTLEQARADMQAISYRLQEQYPDTNNGAGVKIDPMGESDVKKFRPALIALLIAFGSILFITCVNTTNILVARNLSQQKEASVQVMLGLRPRLVQSRVIEILFLCVTGGVLAFVSAMFFEDFLESNLPSDFVERFEGLERAINLQSILIIISATLIMTGILFGLIPLFHALSISRKLSARPESAHTPAGTPRVLYLAGGSLFVAGEVALAVVLLIGAGLLAKSFIRLKNVDLGFNPDNLQSVRIALPAGKYVNDSQLASFYDQALAQIQAQPGVQSADAVDHLPLSGSSAQYTIAVEGRPSGSSSEQPLADILVIGPDYFNTLQAPLLAGRSFSNQDTSQSAPVAIIDETLANRYWPGESPIGKRVSLGGSTIDNYKEIIGVVAQVRSVGLDTEPRGTIYVPYRQEPRRSMALVIRTSADLTNSLYPLHKSIQAVDKDQPFFQITWMEELIFDQLAARRLPAFMLAILAILALANMAVGVYALVLLIGKSINRRARVLMAVGAGAIICMVGLLVGFLTAASLTRIIASQLFGVSATDTAAFAVAGLLVFGTSMVISVIAAYVTGKELKQFQTTTLA
jgi:putative ABC transport system permease protein